MQMASIHNKLFSLTKTDSTVSILACETIAALNMNLTINVARLKAANSAFEYPVT